MKKYFLLFIFCIIGLSNIGLSNAATNKWENIYGISWTDTIANQLRYAQSMGYDGVAIYTTGTTTDFKNDSNAAGLKYYLSDPYIIPEVLGDNLWIDTSIAGTWSASKKDFYRDNMVWGTTTGAAATETTNLSFLASSYFNWSPSKVLYRCQLNWQDQSVIDYVTTRTIAIAHSYETTADQLGHPFTFGGVMFDQVKLAGEFYKWPAGSASASRDVINYWTGTGTGIPGTTSAGVSLTNEYATIIEGSAAWYKALRTELSAEFGTSSIKWIINPSDIYNAANPGTQDEWIYQIKDRADVVALTPDLIIQEGADTGFTDNVNNFNTAAPLIRAMVGSAHHTNLSESIERQIAIACGTSTAWFDWYGNFTASGSPIQYEAITDVPARLLLLRCVPNWDNVTLDGLSTSTTRFVGNDNGTVSYHSEDTNNGSRWNSYISNQAYWVRDHRSSDRKIYACFLANSNMGTVTIPASDGVYAVYSVNGYYEKGVDITSQFTLTNNVLQPISSFSVDTGSGTGVIVETGVKGRMYCEY